MKESRLDKILVDLGYVTEEQVLSALQKQRGLGGRIGSHLLYAKALDEKQLTHALSLQHGVPGFDPEIHRIDTELLERFPLPLIRRHQIMPVAFQPSTGVLSLVVVDPHNSRAVAEVTRLINCSVVDCYVTPEVAFENLVEEYIPDAGLPHDPFKQIELPELFTRMEEEEEETNSVMNALRENDDDSAPQVLLVSDHAFLRNFLVPIFDREGWELVPAADPAEITEKLKGGQCRKVLVARDMAPRFRAWIKRGKVPRPEVEVIEFGAVSKNLLENPVPYQRLFRSLTESLRFAAEQYTLPDMSTPPYDLLRRDVRDLAAKLDLGRLASDGLELATLLIVPKHDQGLADLLDAVASGDSCGIDWPQTLGHAQALAFPWNIEGALQGFGDLLSERVSLDDFAGDDLELELAAQILAIVWHHHQDLGNLQQVAVDRPQYIKTELRKKSGRLARSEIIEAYVRLIESNSDELDATANHQLFVVGKDSPLLTQFATRLRHRGYRPVRIGDLAEAKLLCERQPPTAVFIHDASFPEEMTACRQLFSDQARMWLYAVTTENDPSRVLNLFDAGFDDVFSLPRDIDIVAARLRKAIQNHSDVETPAGRPGRFQATFSALGFTDLLQALSQSQKSVCIRLTRSNGEQAVIHLQNGDLIHGICGKLKGSDAIYRVIVWEEDGEYSVEPADEFPAPNITMPLESILMEGCRILDESRV